MPAKAKIFKNLLILVTLIALTQSSFLSFFAVRNIGSLDRTASQKPKDSGELERAILKEDFVVCLRFKKRNDPEAGTCLRCGKSIMFNGSHCLTISGRVCFSHEKTGTCLEWSMAPQNQRRLGFFPTGCASIEDGWPDHCFSCSPGFFLIGYVCHEQEQDGCIVF